MSQISKKTFKAGFVVLFVGIAFFYGYSSGVSDTESLYRTEGLKNTTEGKPDDVDFAAFWKAWNTVNDKFVTPIATTTPTASNQERVWGAIDGMTRALGDPYTVFFPPEEAKMFQSEISGSFEGIGIEIGIKDGILTVVAPLKGTPAERSGIRSGDKILQINGVSTIDTSTDAAVSKIRGKRGTAVKLLIQRTDKKDPFEVSIVREVISIPTISTEKVSSDSTSSEQGGMRSDGVFVIKLYSFNSQSPMLFRGALREFVQSGGDKLVLDLRGNPGGYLEAAVDMASWFLPAGKTVVREQYAKSNSDVIYRSRGYDIFGDDLKMAILVNNGSASASEILAGALREYDKAVLVGTKTFGKGSVQELVTITPETSLKITIARWVTPNGHSISLEGLKPDYEVEMKQSDLDKGLDPQLDKAVDVLLSM